jgi:glycosyltransferase involved in cell wall biosynthesis
VRITYVGPVPPIRGGIAQHGANLVRALRAEGCAVEVVSWRSQYPRLLFKGQQADTRGAHGDGVRFSLRWWDPLSWIRAGRAAARSDLIVFPWVTPAHAIHTRVILAAAGRTPAVAIVHNPRPHEPMPFDRPLLRMVLARVRGAVVHSRGMVADLSMLAPIPHVLSVAHPSNFELAPAPFPPRPPLRLLFLGYVRPYKGVEVALEALRLLGSRGVDARLTVAGEFWEPVEVFDARVRELGLAGRVDLRPGYVPDEELASLLAGHHALVAPYVSASQSGVAPLALAAGRPVVATAVGGLPEIVREGLNGALAAPSDPRALADAIERVAHNLEELGRGARASSASWAEVARTVLAAAQ